MPEAERAWGRRGGRPRSISEEAFATVLLLHQGGLGYRGIARELRRQGVNVDPRTIARYLKAHTEEEKV